MVGRSLRYSEGKIAAIILDHTDNYERLGLPDTKRNWTLDGIEKSLPTEEEGDPRNRERKPLTHREGELVEVYSNLLINKDASSNFIEDVGGVIEPEMIAIRGGTFLMGSKEDSSEKPIHQVTVPAFALGKYPITQEQYQAVMGTNPSYFKGAKNPVESISWNDAVEFCRKLSQKTGKKYRLPSEAEWEYACHAGIQTKYYFGNKYCFGDDEGRLKDYAWYSENSGETTHPVGKKKKNAFGLYDMHGNVWEWCSDRWHENYNKAPTDGRSWETGTVQKRVLRGGSCYNFARYCRSANRLGFDADGCNYYYGFRVVCVPLLSKAS